MSNFPAELDPLLPTPGAGESLGGSSPTHPEHHTELEARTRAMQAAVGKSGSADTASIEYRLAGVIAAADAAASAAADAAADAISALANAALASSDLADHEVDTGAHDIAATVATAIAAHESALDPHAGYALEADLGAAALLDVGTAPGTVAAGDDPRFGTGGLSEAEADLLYAPIAKGVTNGDSHNHDGGDGAQIAYASLSGLPTLGTAAAAATGDFEASDAVSTHNAASGAHGATATGAAVLTAASQSAGRTALGLGTAATTASTAYEASGAVSAHVGGTGVHTIAGVTGLQGALDAKAPTASPTFTGPVSGITAAMVGAPTGSGTSTGTNTGDAATPAETTNSIGTLILGATSKTTPVDADQIGLVDSAAANVLKKLSWANIKAALSGLYVLLAGKAGGQTIIGDTASGGHLTLKATSHTTQGIVRIDNGARINSVATEEYVRARGMSLISNGSGLMYNNNNFSSYTFDSTDTASGGGSFRINGTYVVAISGELIPVDTLGARYVLSLLAKAGDVGGGNFNPANKQYFGVALYDADGLSISSPMGAKFTGSTDTTLAVALNPGDTTITLTDATGWNSTGAAAGRNFAWYGYSNSFGYTYPNYTYTRNISNSYGSNNSLGAWASGGISGNVITLRVPWTGPALAAGAAVRNVSAGGSYKYIALAAGTVPNAWTPYSGFIGGIASDSSDGGTNFRHGTAFVKFVHLINYHAGGADTNIRLSTLKLSVVSSANLEDRIGVGAAYKLLIPSSLPTNGLAVEGKFGVGTSSPARRGELVDPGNQLRLSYGNGQFVDFDLGSTGNLRIPAPVVSMFPSSITPGNNSEGAFQLTSNTQATLKVRGTDGVVRSVNLTLS